MSQSHRLFAAAAAAALCCTTLLHAQRADARITKFVIETRESPTFGGASFGVVGQYEKIKGRVSGEVDPKDPRNALIQDINLAPRNARGNVEYSATVLIYRPLDATKSNGLLFYSVPNRGNVGGFPGHVGSGGNDPTTAADAGDGFLMKRGDTVVFSGWQGDILAGNNRQLLTVPVAKNADGSSITGRVRFDYALSAPANSLVLAQTFYSGTSHVSYETTSLDNSSAMLTMRVHVNDAPLAIPNSQWAFADCSTIPFPGTPDTRHICLQGGFDTNHLYELIYTAKDPLVLGLGFAATRDLGSFLLHATADDSGTPNPVANQLRAATMVGDSQSGNFVRSYLDLGFNQDENSKIVFNGVNANLAGKRTILNARFAQPGGGSSQHEYYLVPGAEFPVAYDSAFDPVTNKNSGLLDRCKLTNTCPKVIQSATSTEYWQYVESLNHTDPTGTMDLPVAGDVRFYHFTGTQHGPAANPAGSCQQPGNPSPILEIHRALFVALENWVLNGTAPPASKTSTIAEGALVKISDLKWPKIPGVTAPGVINLPTVINFGPAYDPRSETGVFSEPTSAITTGTQYGVRIPQVDADGNEIGGVRSATQRVPLGTYTGWGLRRAGFGEGDLCALQGQFIPFAKTAAERAASGDPRPSMEERYHSFSGYYYVLASAVNSILAEGFMLPEDAQRVFNAGLQQVLSNNLLPKDALAEKLIGRKVLHE